MLTADTITDDQIRELDTAARGHGYDADHGTASLCWLALHGSATDAKRARDRLASIINAKCPKAPPGIGHVSAPLDDVCIRCGKRGIRGA